MNIMHKHKGVDYVLTNDNLQVGDKVYPIGWGCAASTGYIHFKFDFSPSMSGFPSEPHIIEDRHYMNHRVGDPEEIRTNHGYGPSQQYYKIVCSFNKADYYVKEYTISDFHSRKKTEMIYVYDKFTYAHVISIKDNTEVRKHILLKDLLTNEEIDHIIAYFKKPYEGLIKPSYLELNKILAHDKDEPRTIR